MTAHFTLGMCILASCFLAISNGCAGRDVERLFPGTGASGAGGQEDGTGGGAPSECAVAAPCSDQEPCCSQNTLLRCDNNRWTADMSCAAEETCDIIAGCVCKPGVTRCASPLSVQVCESLGEATPAWVGHGCYGTQCVDGFCPTRGVCEVGQRACGDDADLVLECLVDPVTGLTAFVPTLSCGSSGFENGCAVPPPNYPVTKTEDYCLNACNVRGVPLDGELCGPPSEAGLQCAVLVCTSDGTSLVPDHQNCKSAGQPCAEDGECASCICSNAFCLGPSMQHCPEAALCP